MKDYYVACAAKVLRDEIEEATHVFQPQGNSTEEHLSKASLMRANFREFAVELTESTCAMLIEYPAASSMPATTREGKFHEESILCVYLQYNMLV